MLSAKRFKSLRDVDLITPLITLARIGRLNFVSPDAIGQSLLIASFTSLRNINRYYHLSEQYLSRLLKSAFATPPISAAGWRASPHASRHFVIASFITAMRNDIFIIDI